MGMHVLNLLCAIPTGSPLCEENVMKKKIIIQVREEVSALIAIGVLGMFPYYDG